MYKDMPLPPDDTCVFVPEEKIRSIDRALNSIEQARQGFIEARDEKGGEIQKIREENKSS
jgi:hypothetical protein